MADELVKSVSPVDQPDDRRIYGLVNAEVVTNCDPTFMGRVKIRFSWLPGYEPWARVATLMAGKDCGVFFIPQAGEEVLVAFNHGYINEPYVVGSLPNGHNKPDEKTAKDRRNQRAIRTSNGHELAFNDAANSITISILEGGRVTLGKEKIEMVIGSASVTLQKNGNLTLKGETITLDAKTINILADNDVAIGGSKAVRVDGGSYCSINATSIFIG